MGAFNSAGERLGTQVVWASEIDKHAARNYALNYGLIPAGDITKIDVKDIPYHHIITGGFPCQAYSIAGRELGFIDPRGRLYLQITRIARAKRPLAIF